MDAMAEALKEFLIESAEGLSRMEQDLVVLEKNPSDAPTLGSVFRAIHSIKSTCGFLGFGHLEKLTHSAESVLAELRDGKIPLTRPLTSALLTLIDSVRHMLSLIENTGADGDNDYSDLIATFEGLRSGRMVAAPTGKTAPSSEEGERAAGVAESSIRVDVGLLDKLMNVVGELVLARNQILQYSNSKADPALTSASQRLNLITTELQEGLMKTRMQPISTVWSTFPRLVRDLEVHTGKRVRLEREGSETELDRSLLQAIKDPLTHLVRNAIDHGIESPEARKAAGKSEQGNLRLRAYHESGYVIVEIADDGAGVDPEAVMKKALERGLVRSDQAARMSERDILGLLFLPGFSTAREVTSISGRGVGLDVVKNNVERVGGSVDIQTRPGHGTSFKIKIPLTLAIIPALVVSCQNDRYAIPQVNLLELVRLEGEELRRKIEEVHGALVYRLRGRLLPLVDLRQVLGLAARDASAQAANILVLQSDNREYGLIVDSVHDTEEIVVKPLGKQIKSAVCFAGATIMGDGRVALILDALAIAQRGRVVAERRESALWARAQEAKKEEEHRRHSLLLFRTGAQGRAAIPLSLVARLEEFPVASVEHSAGREVVQYRGEILPLVRLGALLAGGTNGGAAKDEEVLQVIVHASRRGNVGFVVDGIVDILEEEVSIQRQDGSDGLLGSAVVQGRVTDFLDVEKIMDLAGGAIFRAPEHLPVAEASRG